MEKLDGIKGDSYIVDPKACAKEKCQLGQAETGVVDGCCCRVVCLQRLYRVLVGCQHHCYIALQAVTKEELYGKMDATTLEWTDGVFTDILRYLQAACASRDKCHRNEQNFKAIQRGGFA
eukprot:6337811-Amphidinium_carterae.1